MKTFISKFLELAEINTPNNEQWQWAPAGNVNCAQWAASTTCCGCTYVYGGGTGSVSFSVSGVSLQTF